MHQASIQGVGGLVATIRQALIGIEAIIGAEANTALVKDQTLRDNQQSSGQESQYLSADEEALTAKMLGIRHE